MRVYILAIAAVAVSSTSPAAEPRRTVGTAVVTTGEATKAGCQRTTSHHALNKDRKVAARKLTELPSANLYKPAYRIIDGCEVPIIAGYGIGATGDDAPARRNRR